MEPTLSPPRGKFIELPLDYSHPERGTFDMYYRLSENFNAKNPTVVFFMGGPGQSSGDLDFKKALPDFNFVFFDQRGVGYSHFRKLEENLQSDYFSSELIAKDVEHLRTELGLEKITVYGQSYGTVPANIYASQYNDHTRALVLEGVVFDGTPDLWNSAYRLKLAQKFYDELKPKYKIKIQEITDANIVIPEWFFAIIKEKMYFADFSEKVIGFLDDLFLMTVENASREILKHTGFTADLTDSIYFSSFMQQQIGCRELSFASERSAWKAKIINGKFVPSSDFSEVEICEEITQKVTKEHSTYYAVNYPVAAPVTYFEGTLDGATVAPNAMKHFKNVPTGFAQSLFSVGNGHSPVVTCIMSGEYTSADPCPERVEVAQAVSHAFMGEPIDSVLVKRMSKAHRWVKGSKLRSKIPYR